MKQRATLRACVGLLGATLVGLGACSSSSTPLASGQAGATGGTTTITGTGGSSQSDAATDVAVGTGSPDADPALPPGLLAASPPDVACTEDVDAAVACDLPRSTCALASECDADVASCMVGGTWIVYYEHPRCLAGRCVWDQEYFQCENNSRCVQGACISILSTA